MPINNDVPYESFFPPMKWLSASFLRHEAYHFRLVEVYDPFQSIYPWLCRIIGRLRPNLVSWSVIGFSTLWDLRFLVSLGVANLIFCHGINIIEKN